MICRNCGTTEGEFKYNPSHKKSGICLPCHREHSRHNQALKRANKRPHLYFQCNDCDLIFYLFKTGGQYSYEVRPRHTCCPNCGSEEIQTFKELLKGIDGNRIK